MLKKWVLILCIFLFGTVCFAGERFRTLPNIENQLSSFDTENITYSYNDELGLLCIDVWIQTKFLKKDIPGYLEYVKKLNQSAEIKNNLLGIYIKKDINLVHYLMSHKKACILGFITFDKKGQIIDSFSSQTVQWQSIPPSSVGDSWYKIIKNYAADKDTVLKSRMKPMNKETLKDSMLFL